MKKILILYSNPFNTERLRLDKEHRAVGEVISAANSSDVDFVFRHAVSIEDILDSLAKYKFSIVQFSGHGSADGIFLESSKSNGGELLSADRIAGLLKQSQPGLVLAIFMSCYSAEAIPHLVEAAPYILTVFGSANDANAIDFIRKFYQYYLEGNSVEHACFFAQNYTKGSPKVVLSRRGLHTTGGSVFFQVFPSGNHTGDSFLVDLREAEADISKLDISREDFLSILSRKIRLHQKIFDSPREKVFLPIGYFFGMFSWQNASDVITCHRIMRIKPDVGDSACELLARQTVGYNDDAGLRYRVLKDPAAPQNDKYLGYALNRLLGSYRLISNYEEYISVFTQYVPDQFKVTKAVMKANLNMAETKLEQGDLASVVFHLECTLSAEHDLLNALIQQLTMND